jgi:SAM-dependent methyltransferase
MNINDIIKDLKKYIIINPKLIYYNEYILKLEQRENNILEKIPLRDYLLESIKIHLLYNESKYNLYIYNKKKKNCAYIKYKLTDDILYKFLYQLITIKEDNSILGLAKKHNLPKIDFKKKDNFNIVYLNISEKKFKFNSPVLEIKNLYESLGYLLGIEIFNILKYQRLDRIINFISNNKEAQKIFDLNDKYLKLIQTFDWKDRDSIIIFSGTIFHALGLTYTRDIDIIYIKENPTIIKKIKDSKLDIDFHILKNDGSYIKNDTAHLNYTKSWLSYLWPQLGGAKDIFEIFSNPKFYFTFMGIKFISLEHTIQRILSRSNVSSVVDLFMLEKINNMNLGSKFCIPNLTIRQGNLVIFDKKYLEYFYPAVKQKIKEYYNEDIPLSAITKRIQSCFKLPHQIYKNINLTDVDTDIIRKYHIGIKFAIYNKYTNNINYLLDVGSGRLTDLNMWKNNNIKNVYGIEPSIDSINFGKGKIKNLEYNNKINIINSIANVDWQKDKKFKDIINKKFDVITFQYTLHYMFNDIDLMINNIKLVVKPKTKIIITCMDGNKINDEIIRNKKIEIRNDEEPIFAIYPYNSYDSYNICGDILVYFKGAYGVSSGSIEPIVDINKLINKFSNNDFKLIEKKNFLEFTNVSIRNKMNHIQKLVSSYYMLLVFEYK